MRRLVSALAAVLVLAAFLPAQRSAWETPHPPFRIVGNLYYVGTADLACYLLTTSEGHILVNTGLESSAGLIRDSIEALGYRYEDIRVLLTNQAHYDHVAAFNPIKKQTGAEVWAAKGDAQLLEDGGRSDHLLGSSAWFLPVKVDRILEDGEKISLGDTTLEVILAPGHTPGSAMYRTTITDRGTDYDVLLANMGSVNEGSKLVDNPKYPGIADDYRHTFKVQKALEPEIWLAAHGSQFGMGYKYRHGEAYDPSRFIDLRGYQSAVADYESKFEQELARQLAQ